jgi:hypothetical protein
MLWNSIYRSVLVKAVSVHTTKAYGRGQVQLHALDRYEW